MTDSVHTETTEGKIIINLFAPNLPGSTKEDDLIQKSLRDQLVESIRNSVTLPDADKSAGLTRFIDESGRNVFFVDGTRGAGKTTFINSVVKSLNSDTGDVKVSIKCLPTIDPTKLPRHEPILVTVTARLNKMVSDKLKGCWSSNDHKKQKEQWQNHLAQLQRGLHLLTDKEYKPEYFSDALKLDAQLDYSIGGQDLSEIFDKLVERACDILGCKAILITFDDIDTQFDAGWDVLESIRKFFNSQKLVVVATGDLRLYSQLIRGKQYENYSKTLLDQEKESARLAERGYMVEHLEQQYLLKLFPVQKRMQLKTMLQLVGEKGRDQHSEKISVLYSKGSDGIKVNTVRSALENIVSNGLNIRVGSDLDMYVDELLKQPVRLLMQVMQDYYSRLQASSISESVLLRDSLYGAMLSSIYRVGLNYEQHRIGMDSLCDDIFRYSRQDQEVNTGFYLRPQSSNEALRNCSVYLASQVSALCDGGLSQLLQLMLVGCGSVSLFDSVQKLVGNHGDRYQQPTDIEFKSYMSIGRRESVTNWANRSCAVISDDGSLNTSPGVYLGMIHMSKKKRAAYKALDINAESGLAKVALAASLSSALTPSPTDFLSVFNLIGAIADLADVDTGVSEIKEIETTAEHAPAIHKKIILENESFRKAVIKIIAKPTCVAPLWSRYAEKGVGEEVDELDVVDEKDISASIVLLIKWNRLVRQLSSKIKPSSMLIGKIWTRLFFNLSNIAAKHKSLLGSDPLASEGKYTNQTNAAKIMRFNVLAFLHAVLVEEDAYHRVSESSVSCISVNFKQNPVTSVGQLVTKLQSMENLSNISNTHPIFYSILKCPLVHPFIFPLGSINSADNFLSQQEKILLTLLDGIIGNGFKDKVQFSAVESLDSSESVLGFKFLNVAGIAAAPYESKKKSDSANSSANPAADE
ncbi:TPA: archaeal ATPase [Klebsiella variicola]|nr:archaeal ATPase [Klebsiella variicola]HBZ7503551.1 archaeal ATPase [Klebsiella variicola subsp. variicola]MBZ6576953.1 archaeal ATPase [Klebsiella variicola]MBZ7119620.1 archaeal ATPase [Klebsiella variicola]MBZ7581454.1 archaeal ATPase [Klebsiella variicola]